MEHMMKLQSKYYNYMLYGTKRIELRLLDEKRQLIMIGDVITFLNESNINESFNVKVVELLHYNSFEEMFEDFDISVLCDKSMTKDELLSVLNEIYPFTKQRNLGVLGIRIELV